MPKVSMEKFSIYLDNGLMVADGTTKQFDTDYMFILKEWRINADNIDSAFMKHFKLYRYLGVNYEFDDNSTNAVTKKTPVLIILHNQNAPNPGYTFNGYVNMCFKDL